MISGIYVYGEPTEKRTGRPVFLKLEHALESPGGLVESYCWAPIPGFLIEHL